ncbi:long-chain fatty acid transport protein 2 isoform X2 [Magallana gigas]|uniref:long-chain fatty acid transport protein 2 isoform X2 n=1 Tax=Magallana gigas TaxID=29159 RepID=UPI003342C541
MPGGGAVLAAVAGGLGTGAFVWRGLYPTLMDDIKTIYTTRKPQAVTARDVASWRFVIDMFEETSRLHPERVFIVFEDKNYTYAMVDAMANRVANVVAAWNLTVGETVAIMAYNSPEFLWTFLGVLKLGLAGTFINYHLQEEPLIHSLTASRSRHLIVGRGLPKPAIISQGKGIRQTHGYRAIDFSHQDVTYVVTPLYHSAATCVGVFNTIGEGATIVLRRKFSASHYWEDVRKYKVTVIQYIGELCRYLLRVPKHPLDGVHSIRAAFGNGLRSDIWDEFKTRFRIPQIYEFFGATEGTALLMNCCNKVGAIGRWSPIIRWVNGGKSGFHIVKFDPVTEQPIRDKEGKCIPIQPGESGLLLAVKPPNTVTFYLGPKAMNEKKLMKNVLQLGDEFFNFGDLVYLDHDYYVYFRDRIGDTFRWKGENVSTTEVANVMTQLNFIHDVNVYGVSISGSDGRAGMAAVQLEEGYELTSSILSELYSHVVGHLPHYARPVFIRVVQEFNTTQTMKHQKLRLVEEGFDVEAVRDPLFVINNQSKTYEALTASNIGTILTARL